MNLRLEMKSTLRRVGSANRRYLSDLSYSPSLYILSEQTPKLLNSNQESLEIQRHVPDEKVATDSNHNLRDKTSYRGTAVKITKADY